MRQILIKHTFLLLTLSAALTGCLYSSDRTSVPGTAIPDDNLALNGEVDPQRPAEELRATGGALGGYIEQYMDANDKSKMARALDGGLGKAATWRNPVSGASFAVTPLRKVSRGDGICRAYSISMTKTGVTDRVGGTACIGDDGSWHVAG